MAVRAHDATMVIPDAELSISRKYALLPRLVTLLDYHGGDDVTQLAWAGSRVMEDGSHDGIDRKMAQRDAVDGIGDDASLLAPLVDEKHLRWHYNGM